MRRFFTGLLLGLTGYGLLTSGGWGTGMAFDTVLWNHYAQTAIAVYADGTAGFCEAAHPLVNEPEREPPEAPPPARMFISAEGRYAIRQGWLAGEDYDENRIATRGDAIMMLMYMAGLDPTEPLTQQDFLIYLGFLFPHMPEEGILETDVNADGLYALEREVTLAEIARAAYRLRGILP